jgi:phenylalanyl-tRNA synthetase beta chain
MFGLRRAVREILRAAGTYEAITYVTVAESQLEPFTDGGQSGFVRRAATSELVRLRNPLQADRQYLRPAVLPTLLESLAANLKHQSSVRLAELGRTYLPAEGLLPEEIEVAAITLAGRREPLAVDASGARIDFSDIKGVLEVLFERLGLMPTIEVAAHPALHPGRAAEWRLGDVRLALAGELHPGVAARVGIADTRVAVAEVDLTAVLAALPEERREVSVPRFLPVQQDFAVVVAEETPAVAVERALLDAGRPLATDIALFDIYRGAQIGDGRKSLAYRVTFLAPDRALTDAELVKVRGKIEKSLRHRVDGQLRA